MFDNNKKQFKREIMISLSARMGQFGEGIAGHIDSFSALDNISHYRLDPIRPDKTLMAQAGYSAEVKQVARANANAAIRDSYKRVARTDDVGSVNHPKYDAVATGKKGNVPLDGAGNYVGGIQQKTFFRIENYDKLIDGKYYDKYQDTPLLVPKDQFDDIHRRWNDKATKLEMQEARLKLDGETEKAQSIHEKLLKLKDVKKRLKRAEVSTRDALEARLDPALSVFKDVMDLGHRAGTEAAAVGAIMSLATRVFFSLSRHFKGEQSTSDSLQEVALDTTKAAAVAYASGATTAIIGGVLKNANEQVIKNLAKKSGPAAILNMIVVITKQVSLVVGGKISKEEFVSNIGQEGVTLAMSMTGAQTGAIAGTLLCPGLGTIVGGFVGGVVGSLVSGALYQEIQNTLADTRLSAERRERLEILSREIRCMEQGYRSEMQKVFSQFFKEKEAELSYGFELISDRLKSRDSLHEGLSVVASAFQLDMKFTTETQFARFHRSGQILRLD